MVWTLGATALIALSGTGCGSSAGDPPGSESSGGDASANMAGMPNAEAGTSAGSSTAGGLGGAGGTSTSAGAAGSSNAGAGALGPFSIVATSYGACALDGSGAVHCWGATPGEWKVPAGSFAELRGGGDWVCAIRADRSYTCFAEPVGEPGMLEFAPDVAASDLAVNGGYVCAIDAAGAMSCGRANFNTMDITPPAGKQFEHVSVGAGFACGTLAIDRSVQCWGFSGEEGAACQDTPAAGQLAAPAGAFRALRTSGLTTCALDMQGAVKCWGAGKPGDDATATCAGAAYNFGQAAPVEGKYRDIGVSWNHTCGVKTDGTLACWGAGTTDECTLDTTDNCRQSLPPSGKFEQVASGSRHTCAMTADRKVQCWGFAGGGTDLSPGGRTDPPAVFK